MRKKFILIFKVVLGHPPRVEPESNKRENDIISPILKLGKYAKKSTEAKEFVPKKVSSVLIFLY